MRSVPIRRSVKQVDRHHAWLWTMHLICTRLERRSKKSIAIYSARSTRSTLLLHANVPTFCRWPLAVLPGSTPHARNGFVYCASFLHKALVAQHMFVHASMKWQKVRAIHRDARRAIAITMARVTTGVLALGAMSVKMRSVLCVRSESHTSSCMDTYASDRSQSSSTVATSRI